MAQEATRAAIGTYRRPRYSLALMVGISVSVGWFGLLAGTAFLAASAPGFVSEWSRLQGFPVIAIGTTLSLIAWQGGLYRLVLRLLEASDRQRLRSQIRRMRRLRIWAILVVTTAGTGTLIALGFPGSPFVRALLWISCAFVCLLAAVATAHGLEIILACRFLERARVKVFTYSPAETTQLRRMASYSTNYGLLLSLGYLLTVAATVLPEWSANAAYVRFVQVFWPILYVPFCLTLLIYPHATYHRIIRRHKEALMESCQTRIERLLNNKNELDRPDIERSNAWADLFERVSKTPDFAVDFGIAARTVVPVIANLISLLPNKAQLGDTLRSYVATVLAP